MPRKTERNPVEEVVNIWNSASEEYRQHFDTLWPDLADALKALSHALEHAPLSPGAVPVPVVTPSGPARRPRSRSAGRSGSPAGNPTSGHTQPPLDPFSNDSKDN